MKIVDSFMFFNERDLVYLRIKELYDVVDYFVINELSTTHKGIEKESIFWKDKRLESFKDKIKYTFIDVDYRYNQLFDINFKDSSHFIGSWAEHEQRLRLMDQINELNLSDEDIVLFSDCDEIPNKNKFNELENYDLVALNQMFFVHYINLYTNKNVTGTIAVKYGKIKEINKNNYNLGLQILRRNKDYIPRREDVGWHYSYMGGPKTMSEKVISIYEGNPDSPLKDENKCKEFIDQTIKDNKSPFSEMPLRILDLNTDFLNLDFITAINGTWQRNKGNYKSFPSILKDNKEDEFKNLIYNNE
jgi:beta-1,4-mannosyl-glycoprotein beta-1,4-N-acetylglucosaminyltransferase